MGPVVPAHVDELLSLCGAAEGRFSYLLRPADKGHHRAVGRLPRVHVQDLHPFDGRYGIHDGVYFRPVAPLAEVRDTFDYSLHTAVICSAHKGTKFPKNNNDVF